MAKKPKKLKLPINIDYEYTSPDGAHVVVNMVGATPEQAAVVTWLRAEAAWRSKQDWANRERERKLKEKQAKAELKLKIKRAEAQHKVLIEQTTGFRRAVLERHAPQEAYIYDRGLICSYCDDGSRYEPDAMPFPCVEYQFAREWEEESP
jgi:hypothetical protein